MDNNNNLESKDLTQYSLKCASILSNIFDTVDKFHSKENGDKEAYYEKLSEEIKDFELLLDKCYVDVNESICKIAKAKFEQKINSNNINETQASELENRNFQGDFLSIIHEKPMSDKELIDFVTKEISNINLDV